MEIGYENADGGNSDNGCLRFTGRSFLNGSHSAG